MYVYIYIYIYICIRYIYVSRSLSLEELGQASVGIEDPASELWQNPACDNLTLGSRLIQTVRAIPPQSQVWALYTTRESDIEKSYKCYYCLLFNTTKRTGRLNVSSSTALDFAPMRSAGAASSLPLVLGGEIGLDQTSKVDHGFPV